MSLLLAVGQLTYLDESDSEGAEDLREELDQAGAALRALGLPEHVEPSAVARLVVDAGGHSGVHQLRRLAAWLELEGRLPDEVVDDATADPVLVRYEQDGRVRSFDHLIRHSDAEGLYLPLDLPAVVVDGRGRLVGSSVRLLDELDRLATAMALPEDLHQDDRRLRPPPRWSRRPAPRWHRFGQAVWVLLCLRRCARASTSSGSALVFC